MYSHVQLKYKKLHKYRNKQGKFTFKHIHKIRISVHTNSSVQIVMHM